MVHLDRLFGKPGWAQSARDEFVDATRRALRPDGRWVADGNYADTLDVRVRVADRSSSWTCRRRSVSGASWPAASRPRRPEMAPGCEDRILRRDYAGFLHYVAT